jgi:hypothetical protein
MNKVLFILKRKEGYSIPITKNTNDITNIGLTTGLYNSSSFVNDMLIAEGVQSKMVIVTDNNDIHREVVLYNPTHVIIEALWVVPSKFTILTQLHPTVKWIIRLHSAVPFLSNEGMAMGWLADYARFENLVLASNSPEMYRDLITYLSATKIDIKASLVYLPNYFPQEYKYKRLDKHKDTIDMGCFGSIRPLKNHLIQAVAAINFANKYNKKLRFHVNSERIEMKGQPVLNNLMSMFAELHDAGHELINHPWLNRVDFLNLCGQMDIGLQCSFNETFNIVGADIISQGVPLVYSSEIPWAIKWFSANPTDSDSITKQIEFAYNYSGINVSTNQWRLTKYTNEVKHIWLRYLSTEDTKDTK